MWLLTGVVCGQQLNDKRTHRLALHCFAFLPTLQLNKDVYEMYTWHGSGASNIASILKSGQLRPGANNVYGMYLSTTFR